MRVISFLIVFMLFANFCDAGMYHLRADGQAKNKSQATGSRGLDTFMSISTHNNQSFSPGDILVFHDEGGPYREQLRIRNSGTKNNRIIYTKDLGDSPMIRNVPYCIDWRDADYVTIIGFICTNATSTSYHPAAMRVLGDADYGVVLECEFSYSFGGIKAGNSTGSQDNWLIERCIFHHNQYSGLEVNVGHHWHVRFNESHHNCLGPYDFGGGIRFIPPEPSKCSGHLIENNYVHHNGMLDNGEPSPRAAPNTGEGIWLDTCSDEKGPIVVRWNTSEFNRISGLFCENTKGSYWESNISRYNKNGFRLTSSGGGHFINEKNAIYWNNIHHNPVGLWAAGDWSIQWPTIVDNVFAQNFVHNYSNKAIKLQNGAQNKTLYSGSGTGNIYVENTFDGEFINFLQSSIQRSHNTIQSFENTVDGADDNILK